MVSLMHGRHHASERASLLILVILVTACQQGSQDSRSGQTQSDSARARSDSLFQARWKETARYRERRRTELTAKDKFTTVNETTCEMFRVLGKLGQDAGLRALAEADSLVDRTRTDSQARRHLDTVLSGKEFGLRPSDCDSIRASWPPLDSTEFNSPYTPSKPSAHSP